MTTPQPRFSPGDDVLVVGGYHKGRYGRVASYEDWCGMYMVQLPELDNSQLFSLKEDELDFLPDEEEEEIQADDIEFVVPPFGMTPEAFAAHMEFMVSRVTETVTETGPGEAFFGFQGWEALPPKEIYVQILRKIEDGMRLFVQLHVLTARVGFALEQMNDQD